MLTPGLRAPVIRAPCIGSSPAPLDRLALPVLPDSRDPLVRPGRLDWLRPPLQAELRPAWGQQDLLDHPALPDHPGLLVRPGLRGPRAGPALLVARDPTWEASARPR